MKPNYELLKDAYAIIDGIPDKVFHLAAWVTRKGKALDCGTVACAGGWLSMHPQFNDMGLKLNAERFPVLRGLQAIGALAALFNLEYSDALDLFGMRPICGGPRRYDPPNADRLSDKELWKARVRNFLNRMGAL
jgi:hypothetical protein